LSRNIVFGDIISVLSELRRPSGQDRDGTIALALARVGARFCRERCASFVATTYVAKVHFWRHNSLPWGVMVAHRGCVLGVAIARLLSRDASPATYVCCLSWVAPVSGGSPRRLPGQPWSGNLARRSRVVPPDLWPPTSHLFPTAIKKRAVGAALFQHVSAGEECSNGPFESPETAGMNPAACSTRFYGANCVGPVLLVLHYSRFRRVRHSRLVTRHFCSMIYGCSGNGKRQIQNFWIGASRCGVGGSGFQGLRIWRAGVT
jgi:hypothetical protein